MFCNFAPFPKRARVKREEMTSMTKPPHCHYAQKKRIVTYIKGNIATFAKDE